MYNNLTRTFLACDAPSPWGVYFQDSGSPQMEALVELHDNIMFYLVIILFGVGWILVSILRRYLYNKSPISNKYFNHGKCVPVQKYYNNVQEKSLSPSNISTINNNTNPVKLYENALIKKEIINENKNKSGIYLLTNLITNDKYVGQSTNLGKRFEKYFTLSYLKDRNSLVISRVLIKHGYANFSLSILEYCDKGLLNQREQYFLDSIKPAYNILKVADISISSGYKHTQKSKNKRSKSLKRMYTWIKSLLYWITRKDETKALIREKAIGRKNLQSTLELMNKVKGNPVNIYEKCSGIGFKFIGGFISPRKAGLFMVIRSTTIIKYMRSGKLFKGKYKFSNKLDE